MIFPCSCGDGNIAPRRNDAVSRAEIKQVDRETEYSHKKDGEGSKAKREKAGEGASIGMGGKPLSPGCLLPAAVRWCLPFQALS